MLRQCFLKRLLVALPSLLIAELMGIAPDDGRRLYALTERMHQTGDPADALRHTRGLR